MLPLGSWVDSCGLNFVARGAHPSGVVGEGLALLSLQTRLHLTPPLPDDNGGVDAGRPVPRRPRHLPGKTGALDRLGPLLNAVLVAAPVRRDHLARPSFWPVQVVLLQSVLEGPVAEQHRTGTYPQGQRPGHRRDHGRALNNPAGSRARESCSLESANTS